MKAFLKIFWQDLRDFPSTLLNLVETVIGALLIIGITLAFFTWPFLLWGMFTCG